VMASNGTTIADEEGEFDDWFELYNPADTAVDLSFWFATDDYSEPRKWMFPNGTIIDPYGYLILWADNDAEQGALHTSFKLDADGEEVAVFGPDFYSNTLCDSISWIDMPRDSSWGRYPNGSTTWQICLEATPGAANDWTFVVYDNSTLPGEFSFSAYPNPFNSAVRIAIDGASLESGAFVEIFDITGRRIDKIDIESKQGIYFKDDTQANGNERTSTEIVWRPEGSVPSGIYLVRASLGDESASKRIVYMK
ncbi:MAG: lamin tail domain-containing protein, partial [bacterium]